MNSEERQLITRLLERMQGVGPIEKDRDAEALINEGVRQIPDAPYMLVQSVLVQEHALQQAGARIEELEAQVRALESRQQAAPAQAGDQGAGGFLGGLFGGARPAQPGPRAGSVPAAGRPSGLGMNRGQDASLAGGSPWNRKPQGVPAGQQAAAPGQGGSFMRSAMATAAGVAGGMLLANSISSMFGGGDKAHASDQASSPAADTQHAANADQAAHEEPQYQDSADNDPGVYDAGYDDGGGWGADDFDL